MTGKKLKPHHHTGLKLRLAFQASKNYLQVTVWFFVGGFLYFALAHPAWALVDWIAATFFAQTPAVQSDPLSLPYSVLGSVVITQGVMAVVFTKVEQSYNPAKLARMLARKEKDHAIVLGFGHLGRRIYGWFKKQNFHIVVIERDEAKVRELIERGEPVVLGNVADEGVLEEANVQKAHDVVQTFNDVRTALIAANRVHTLNPKCDFWVRCLDDNVQKILKDLGANPFSTSKWIAEKLLEDLPPAPEKIILIGFNHVAAQFIRQFEGEKRPFVVVEDNPQNAAELREEWAGVPVVEGILSARPTLEAAGVATTKGVIICIQDREEDTLFIVRQVRRLNPEIRVYARMYDDELAKVIESMGGHPFSSSEFAFNKLLEELKQ